MNLRFCATRMNNLREDLMKTKAKPERDANNLKKKLFFYLLKFKDLEAQAVPLKLKMKLQRENSLNMNLN